MTASEISIASGPIMQQEGSDKDTSMRTILSDTGSQFQNVIDSQEQAPIFFNYHEFGERYYANINSPGELREHDEEHALCVTHFPNVYVARNSPEFKTTRIVRVPRRFEDTLDYPCFSTVMPGMEPAALSGSPFFQPVGIFDEDDQLFGYSSVSPLAQLLSAEQFHEIVNTVNEYLRDGFYTYSWFNMLDLLLEVISLGLWRLVSNYIWRHPLLHLEDYVLQVCQGEEFKKSGLKIISPRRSGYLSVCV